MKTIAITLAAAALLSLTGCVSNPPAGASASSAPTAPPTPTGNKSEQALQLGIYAYEQGNYPEATRDLQAALAGGGLNAKDQVRAYKYLAFTDCVNSREKSCRDNFRKALDINPGLELTPAEAGHPLWGPVFQSVKGGKKK